jgi:uncharacterized protein YecE (DUF72 family)
MRGDIAGSVPRKLGLRDAHTNRVARAYIGTSGWVYAGWREHLYADTPTKKWLHVASRAFDALEINGSFYTQIKPETYTRWYDETPPEFRFALKGHRFVTHYKRLRDCRDSIVRLRDQVQPLKEKLAAVVWQLPSNFQCAEAGGLARLEDFMRSLQAWRDVRHALELRHRSWFTPAVAAILRANNVAVCMGDAPDFPMWREVTADLVYVRLHGRTRKYASSYSERSLQDWAASAKQWLAEGRDVHVYFDNDAEGHAVRNALRFQELVVGTPPREIPASAYAMPSPERKPYPSPWRSVNRAAGRSLTKPPDESAPRARRAAARSAPDASGSAHDAPSPRPTAQPRSPASSAHRSTARTGSRVRRPASR